MAELTCQAAAPLLSADTRAVLDDSLEDALSMLHADRGNVQIVDPVSGSLIIAVQAGFSAEFLEYFAVVNDDASACGRAAHDLAQTATNRLAYRPRQSSRRACLRAQEPKHRRHRLR